MSAKPQPSAAAAIDPAAILAGPLPPIRTSPLYALALLVVALVMVTLPLIYIGLIALVGWATVWHATHDLTWITSTRTGGAIRGRIFAYVAPIVLGAGLVFFLTKPLFAPRRRGFSGMRVAPEEQPTLYAYVEHLCGLLGAPPPREIWVDCAVNASASFRRGVWSMLGSDLRLTIGLPLAAGMSLRSLTGVLAHEFGHFAQGLGMRASYIIHSVNHWFARVVYERDAWDDWLENTQRGSGGYVSFLLMLVRGVVWLSRRVLWLLMTIGGIVSGFLSRQMEFDADQYEAQVAGSATFADTCRRMHELSFASQAAHGQLGESWRAKRLADDLPALIDHKAGQLPPQLSAAIGETIEQSRTGWFATHPSDRDRIASAARAQCKGVVRSELPASALFDRFDTVCRTVTRAYYADQLGEEIAPRNLIPTDHLLAESGKQAQEARSVESFLGMDPSVLRQGVLPPTTEIDPPASPRELAAEIRAARESMKRLAPAATEAYKAIDACTSRLNVLAAAAMFAGARASVPPVVFKLPRVTQTDVDHARIEPDRQRRIAMQTAREYEDALWKRVVGLIRLLHVPQITQRIPESAAMLADARRTLAALSGLDLLANRVDELIGNLAGLMVVPDLIRGNEDNGALGTAIEGRLKILSAALREIRRDLPPTEYPFEHAAGVVTLAHYLIPEPPVSTDFGVVISAAQQCLGNYAVLAARGLARLVHTASQIEQSSARRSAAEPSATSDESLTSA